MSDVPSLSFNVYDLLCPYAMLVKEQGSLQRENETATVVGEILQREKATGDRHTAKTGVKISERDDSRQG
jgi:hypothetical protein